MTILLDVLIPVSVANVALVPDAIDRFNKCTDIPTRIVVIADGGMRRDLSILESYLPSLDHWKLLHNEKPVQLNQSIREALEEINTKTFALVGPHVRIDDPKWFGKVQQIFSRDPICGIADMWPNTKSSTLYPVKRAQNNPALVGCRFAVVQTAFAKKVPPFGDVDPVAHWSKLALTGGGSAWSVPGVRYFEVEHEEHELWRAPLGSPSRSA